MKAGYYSWPKRGGSFPADGGPNVDEEPLKRVVHEVSKLYTHRDLSSSVTVSFIMDMIESDQSPGRCARKTFLNGLWLFGGGMTQLAEKESDRAFNWRCLKETQIYLPLQSGYRSWSRS
jgi:hypothetical protein